MVLKIMGECKTGANRLKGLLPKDVKVAHKTGTLTGFACDVGILTLSNQSNQIIIAVYIKNSTKELPELEGVNCRGGKGSL